MYWHLNYAEVCQIQTAYEWQSLEPISKLPIPKSISIKFPRKPTNYRILAPLKIQFSTQFLNILSICEPMKCAKWIRPSYFMNLLIFLAKKTPLKLTGFNWSKTIISFINEWIFPIKCGWDNLNSPACLSVKWKCIISEAFHYLFPICERLRKVGIGLPSERIIMIAWLETNWWA